MVSGSRSVLGKTICMFAFGLAALSPLVKAQPPGRSIPESPPLPRASVPPFRQDQGDRTESPVVIGSVAPPSISRSHSILRAEVSPIDLNTALRLAGVQNPELLVARQLVLEAVAQRQLAAAQFIPSFNGGSSYDSHTGNLQQSNGNILSVNRSSVYVGAGNNAVAAGSVVIPGLLLTGNVGEALFRYLIARQVVRQSEFNSLAVRNQAFLRVCEAYCDLLQAEGRRAIAEEITADAEEVAKITASYAKTGLGRPADADRAATELARRRAEIRQREGEMLTASAQLCRVLNLDPSIRLHPTDAYVVPVPIVPDPIPVSELIVLALTQRPEMAERRTVVREALLALHGARVLPFSPTIYLGYSAGGYGGGSNLVRPVFGAFGGRSDFDALCYWTLQNMGVGNIALIKTAKARLGVSEYQQLAMLDRIRDEVAEAYAATHARYQQILEEEEAVRSGIRGFREDLARSRQADGLPIEVLNNLRLKADSQVEYLDAIVDYNRAHFELYVALGQPPAAALARPVPVEGVTRSMPDASQTPATTSPPGSGLPPIPAATTNSSGPAPAPSTRNGVRSPFSTPPSNGPRR
jgi:outer membrane protein TolC